MVEKFLHGDVKSVRKLSLDVDGCPYIGLVTYDDGSRVVVKELNSENKREIWILDKLGRHDNIVEKFGQFRTDEVCNLNAELKDKFSPAATKGIIFEFLSGGNLAGLSRQYREMFIPNIVYDVASALEHSHSKGIVHSDVKPLNIMVNANGSYKGSKLIDFDCSVCLGNKRIGNERKGTQYFRAPEQVYDCKVCLGSDIFSLGLIFYNALAGVELDFGQIHLEQPRDRPSKEHGLNVLVNSMLERDERNRPTAAEVKQELLSYLKSYK